MAAPPLLPSAQAAPAPPVVTSATPPPFPALHLLPLNDTFVPKQISLYPPGQRIKVGRQTNAKTIPNGTNGYFDSKVLSRMHAEVWAEDGKVLIKDVKSSNGTFIDGQRLSPEAAESDVFELRTGVTVEFGIDIVSDDGKSIVHHKVAAKVLVVMNADDVQASSREFNNWYRYIEQQPAQRRGMRQIGTGALGGNSLMGGGQHQNGLNIDHFLGKLQTELAKSRETGSHLNEVSTTLNDVQDTLGGGVANGPLPPPGASAALFSRGLTNGQVNAQQQALAHQQHTQSITQLQNQLQETQQSLAGHVGKMKDLEGLLAEHEAMKREVGSLRRQMETEIVAVHAATMGGDGDTLPLSANERGGRESPIAAMLEAQDRADREYDEADDDDDDDARSVASVDTVVRGASGRPNGRASMKRPQGEATREAELQEQNTRLNARLDQLASELDEAIKLGQTLRLQQEQAATTIQKLEQLISGLEKKVEQQSEAAPRVVAAGAAIDEKKFGDRLESRWIGWKEMFERSWEQEKRDWRVEHGKLKAAVQEWEERRRASSSDEDEEEESSVGTGEGSAAVAGALAGVAGTIAASKSKKRAKRRRKNVPAVASSPESDDVNSSNSAATSSSGSSNVGPSSSTPKLSTASSSSGPNRLSSLARSTHVDDAAASDSDSTIGSRAHARDSTGAATIKRGQRSGVSEWVGGGKGVGGASSRSAATPYGGDRRLGEPGSGVIIIQQKHVTSAVVVVVGVLTAMAVSLKMKE
ncbi:BQ2448_6852 [Microbotryum intermedium]|uniref:BQ2448_6852 protein n=1 Tax=Microbotryum intermedium TaxID=269621 RepID=A0A238FI56_9BASI|nr:BQ2448_6852 [Microbotryum intermedium]